jgi:predicted GTPase
VLDNISELNTRAIVVKACMPVVPEDESLIRGKRALVIEDGPTVTHGGMMFGAGYLAAKKFGAAEIIDPRPYITGSIKETFETYRHIGNLLPAMGYGREQQIELETTINRADCDVVIIGTPIDLNRVIAINHPTCRVSYEVQEIQGPTLSDIIKGWLLEQQCLSDSELQLNQIA